MRFDLYDVLSVIIKQLFWIFFSIKPLVLRCAARQRIPQARPKPLGASDLCFGVSPRGVEPPKTPASNGSLSALFCGGEATATAAAMQQRFNYTSS